MIDALVDHLRGLHPGIEATQSRQDYWGDSDPDYVISILRWPFRGVNLKIKGSEVSSPPDVYHSDHFNVDLSDPDSIDLIDTFVLRTLKLSNFG